MNLTKNMAVLPKNVTYQNISTIILFDLYSSGDRDNNNKFSHCSKSNISAVLDAITDQRKTNCFEESDGAFCGNKIVEEGIYYYYPRPPLTPFGTAHRLLVPYDPLVPLVLLRYPYFCCVPQIHDPL